MSASTQLGTAETALATAIATPSDANLNTLIANLRSAEAAAPRSRGSVVFARQLRRDVQLIKQSSSSSETKARVKALRNLQRVTVSENFKVTKGRSDD